MNNIDIIEDLEYLMPYELNERIHYINLPPDIGQVNGQRAVIPFVFIRSENGADKLYCNIRWSDEQDGNANMPLEDLITAKIPNSEKEKIKLFTTIPYCLKYVHEIAASDRVIKLNKEHRINELKRHQLIALGENRTPLQDIELEELTHLKQLLIDGKKKGKIYREIQQLKEKFK